MSRLQSITDQGLLFFWTLAVAASELCGGKPAVVELTDSDGRAGSARRSDEGPDADDRLESGPSAPDVRVPELHVSLQVDAEPRDGGSDRSGIEALVRRARLLVLREQFHRALLHTGARIRAFESQAVHDLRAHLQPLVLHVSNLRDEGSPSAEDLELLADLTRSLTTWVEEELQSGELVGDRLQPITSGTEGADLRAALEEVLSEQDGGSRRVDLPERLPDLPVDRPSLDAGLRELLRTARGGPWTLQVRRSEADCVRIRFDLGDASERPGTSVTSIRDGSEDPPVAGALLNLTARMGGRLRLEAGSSTDRRIDVRLPASGREG